MVIYGGRSRVVAFVLFCLTFFPGHAFSAATVEKLVKFKMTGGVGAVVNLFGGKAAREGQLVINVVDGSRKATRTGKQVEVIDLDEEVIYRYRGSARRCERLTFAEMEEQLKSLREVFNSDPQSTSPTGAAGTYEVDVTFDKIGSTEEIAGVMGDVWKLKATVHKPGMGIEGGGAVMEADLIVGPTQGPLQEVAEWDQAYAAKVGEMMGFNQGLQKLLLGDPALQKAMASFQAKQAEVKGAVLRVSSSLSVVADTSINDGAQQEDNGNLLSRISLRRKNQTPGTPRLVYESEVRIQSISNAATELVKLPKSCQK